MNKIPFLSIIVPIYNAEKYLANCIESILNQSFEDFELLLINDGSTDRSLEIMNRFKMDDLRVKILSQCNKGVSSARNLGLEYAIGNYITFVDADDTVYLDRFLNFHSLSTRYNADIFLTGYTQKRGNKLVIFEPSCKEGLYSDPSAINELIKSYIGPENSNLNEMLCIASVFSSFFKKQFIYGQQFHNISFSEDKLFLIGQLIRADAVCLSHDISYVYTQSSSSITTLRPYRIFNDIVESALILKEILQTNNLFDIFKERYENMLIFQFYSCLISYSRKKTWNMAEIISLENLFEIRSILTPEKYTHLQKVNVFWRLICNRQYILFLLCRKILYILIKK